MYNKIKDIKQKLFASEFIRGFATLSGGSSIAAIIPILSAPILSRLYAPSEYGMLAAFAGILALFQGIGCWQYEQAVVVEKEDDKALRVAFLCMIVCLLTSIVSVIVVWMIASMGWFQGGVGLGSWMALIPLIVLINGLNLSLDALANRMQMYFRMSKIRVAAVLGSVAFSISYGATKGGYEGLIIAYCLPFLVTALGYLYAFRSSLKFSMIPAFSDLIAVARSHIYFPLYALPASFLGSISGQSPVYAMTAMGYTSSLGFFNRAKTLVSMPFVFLGTPIAQVYKRRATVEYEKYGRCNVIFLKTLVLIVVISVPIVTVLYVYAESIFAIALGENWRDAGRVAKYLLPLIALQWMSNPLSNTLYIACAQKCDFYIALLSPFLTLSAIAISYSIKPSAESIIIGYSVGYSVVYMVYLIVSYRVSLGRKVS